MYVQENEDDIATVCNKEEDGFWTSAVIGMLGTSPISATTFHPSQVNVARLF